MLNTNDLSFDIFSFSGVFGSIGQVLVNTPDDYLPLIQKRNEYQKLHPLATPDELQEITIKLKEVFQPQYTEEYNKNIDNRYKYKNDIIKFFEKIESIDMMKIIILI